MTSFVAETDLKLIIIIVIKKLRICGFVRLGVYPDAPLWNSVNNTEDMNGYRDVSLGDTKWARACAIAGGE